ncbi:MAG: hypothetical protein K9J21_11285, partial [Bacteroidales bacterium]|nr:hypothetical protein [Bacteroidales bacterium]
MKTKRLLLIPLIIFLGFSFQAKAQNGYANNVILQSSVYAPKPVRYYYFSLDSSNISLDTTIKTFYNSSVNYGSNGNFRMAVFSDQNGNLKFYSNGQILWNGQHQPVDSNLLPPPSEIANWNVA